MSADRPQSEPDTPGQDEADPETLLAELELLREENERLRDEFARARTAEYRRSARLIAVVSILSVIAALVFPPAQTVLLALGGSGLFLAILIYYLTPERFTPASVGDGVYRALAHNGGAVVDELGLSDHRVYVPVGEQTVRLFVPQHDGYTVPDDDLDETFVVTDTPSERGLSLVPTGLELRETLIETSPPDSDSEPGAAARRGGEALVEQFELLESVTVEEDDETISVGVSGSAYGDIDRFDHPVVSVLGTMLAVTVREPIETTVEPSDDDRFEYRLTYSWGDTEE